jgi:hypothetical protein
VEEEMAAVTAREGDEAVVRQRRRRRCWRAKREELADYISRIARRKGRDAVEAPRRYMTRRERKREGRKKERIANGGPRRRIPTRVTSPRAVELSLSLSLSLYRITVPLYIYIYTASERLR